jgi:hypothetical protein
MSSFFGWIFESIYDKKNMNFCGNIEKFGLCLPIYTIYGFFSIIMLYFKDYLKNMEIWQLLILLITTIAIFECLSGKISKIINKKQTWNYEGDVCHYYAFCDGYVSVLSSVGFGIISTLYYKFIIEKYF